VTASIRALISVSDKNGLLDFGKRLHQLGVEILSTGGTARALREGGVPVVDVSAFTGAPEILDGRVKTLHPKVAGGILARPTDDHRKQMSDAGMVPIDVVVVNLYPFKETVARGAPFDEVIENIDIGGPTMIRAAAKNHERVAVVVEPGDYGRVAEELETNGNVSAATRYDLARKAFAHTAAYDGAIAGHLGRLATPESELAPFSDTFHPEMQLQQGLRYGENPHQAAAFYRLQSEGPSLADARTLQGKPLSYNNFIDIDAAYKLVAEFSLPAVAIIKHTNPCGAAVGATVLEAFREAQSCDPVSAFGGIVAINRVVDEPLAQALAETFLECIVAPGFDAGARATLAKKKNLRLLELDVAQLPAAVEMRTVAGGVLVQSRDIHTASAAEAKVVTKRAPTKAELADLDFGWRVCKHVKSNAIVFVGKGRTIGVGAGQMSRVDSVKLAVTKSRSPLQGSALASDAFFPFRDAVDEAAKAGVTAVIQPGGSVRDQETIDAADEHGIAMVFTGQRHFRH